MTLNCDIVRILFDRKADSGQREKAPRKGCYNAQSPNAKRCNLSLFYSIWCNMELRTLGGILTKTKSVTLYAYSLVPTLLSYGDIAKKFLEYNNGIYIISGEKVSNFNYQFIVARVESRI